jgi:hypothetical protein
LFLSPSSREIVSLEHPASSAKSACRIPAKMRHRRRCEGSSDRTGSENPLS